MKQRELSLGLSEGWHALIHIINNKSVIILVFNSFDIKT